MTKRTLFIIIGLLMLLDVAAIIIYLSAPTRDGKSPLDTTYDNINQGTHSQADVLPNKATLDDFETIEDTVNYISTDKVMDRGEKKRMSATIIVKLQWPKKINGSKQFLELQNALMTRLTGKTYPNVKQMVTDLTSHPKYVKYTTHSSRIKKDFSSSHGASHTTRRYIVLPHFGTHYRLEMMVVTESLIGGKSSRTLSIVHYDRAHGKVITNDQIFDKASTSDVVALVNQSIEGRKIKESLNLHEVENIPHNFVLGEKYVIFYVEQNSKRYEVKVKNEDLSPYFTNYYNDLIINDTKLRTY